MIIRAILDFLSQKIEKKKQRIQQLRWQQAMLEAELKKRQRA